MSKAQYALIERLLLSVVNFAGPEEYSRCMPEAKKVSPDPDDVDFFALALKLDCPIWSEDRLLKEQEAVRVCSTSEILKEI